jgi:hypothetical protein
MGVRSRGTRADPITFQRALNWLLVALTNRITANHLFYRQKMAQLEPNSALRRRQSYERSRLRHCPEATKMRPRCLIDVAATITGNFS